MKHLKENGVGKTARVRVTLDMLPKSVQRASKDKQLEVLKKIFKRACDSCGLFRDMKEREHYVKPGEKRRKAERLRKAVARGELRDNNSDQEREFKYFDEYNF